VKGRVVLKENAGRVFVAGFRLSALDSVILVAGFVLGHFFLFCNVVRMARPLEFAWAGLFTVLAAATVALDTPGWPITASVSLVATAVVIAIEMRKPSYHGFGWRRINPGLPDWWKKRNDSGPDLRNLSNVENHPET
jgi:hypothetical protein